MIDDGHEVVVMTTTHQPSLTWNGISHIPGGALKFAADGLLEWPKRVKTDILFTLFDIWPFPADIGRKIRELGSAWAPITPVDHDPIPKEVFERLVNATYPIAMSPFGFREMQRVGLTNATYIPHGVDTQVFRPRQQKKEHFHVTDQTFVVGVVATNIEPLDRKGFYPTLQAFGRFHAKHPDSIIYVHANPTREDTGLDLLQIAEQFGFKMHVPDTWILTAGIPVLKMVELYNSFDVMMLLSRGEGFCVPLIEAQACGTPVITTDFTAQSDLVGGGWKVPITGKRFTPMSSFWAEPDVDAAEDALEECYKLWKAGKLKEEMQQKARNFAKQFDIDLVYKTYMRPFLEGVEKDIEGRKSHCEENGHRWSKWTITRGDINETACMDPNCTAGMIAAKGELFVDPKHFPLEFNGVDLRLEDDPVGGVAKSVIRELGPSYGLDSMNLRAGDVVVDIGAHIGTVSIYAAKKWPGVRVYSYEPNKDNFARLQRNIEKMRVRISAHNVAVTGDGREVALFGDSRDSSGGHSIYGEGSGPLVPSTTLASIFRDNNIERCSLLKVDCEGAEYEVLYAAGDLLDRVDNLSIEFHKMGEAYPENWSPDALLEFCGKHIKPGNIHSIIANVGGANETKVAKGNGRVRQAAPAEQGGGIHRGEQRPENGNGRGGGGPKHSSRKRRRNPVRQVTGP
jgi:FkbM family methyltransferase